MLRQVARIEKEDCQCTAVVVEKQAKLLRKVCIHPCIKFDPPLLCVGFCRTITKKVFYKLI